MFGIHDDGLSKCYDADLQMMELIKDCETLTIKECMLNICCAGYEMYEGLTA